MNKLTFALLASAALAMPAAVPAMAQNNPQTQQQQPQSSSGTMQKQSMQKQSMQKPNEQKQSMQKQPMQQANTQQPNQQAANQPISPQQLGRDGVRQVQQALNKDGFNAGDTDGIWGPDTRTALNDFQKSKDIPGQGKLNQQTLSKLGVNVASNDNSGNQNTGNQSSNDMNSAPNQSSTPKQNDMSNQK